jgi:exonuclease VII large subunit
MTNTDETKQPAPTPASPAAPAAAEIVAAGKSEREIKLEKENQKLKRAVQQTAESKRKAEEDAAHSRRQAELANQPAIKQKMSWMGFVEN